MEIAASRQGNAWRAVYTVKIGDAIYVLHVFQKKIDEGDRGAAREIGLIKRRFADAERNHRERQN
jgi:phage-related protein